MQRGRSPFAGRLGEEIGSEALTLADDGRDPDGLGSRPFDGEGTPRGRTALIEGGKLANYLHDSYTARREGNGARSTGNASRAGYRSPPVGQPLEPRRRAGERELRRAARRGGRRRLRHRRRRPALRRQPRLRDASRSAPPGILIVRRQLAKPADGVHDRLRPGLDALRGQRRRRGAALGPVRRLGADAAAADRRDGGRGRLMTPDPPRSVDLPSAFELQRRLEAERRGVPFLLYRAEGEERIADLDPERERLTLGRGREVELLLDDPEVSRVHAELQRTGGEWTVLDDDLSHNGTFVNGERVSGRRRLRDGDQLLVGRRRR